MVDLTGMLFLGVRGLDVLRGLHEQGAACGTQVNLAVCGRGVLRALWVRGLDQLLDTARCAEIIVARVTSR